MKRLVMLAALALAGCGADGEPVRPEARSDVTLGTGGIGVSGTVSVGVSG